MFVVIVAVVSQARYVMVKEQHLAALQHAVITWKGAQLILSCHDNSAVILFPTWQTLQQKL